MEQDAKNPLEGKAILLAKFFSYGHAFAPNNPQIEPFIDLYEKVYNTVRGEGGVVNEANLKANEAVIKETMGAPCEEDKVRLLSKFFSSSLRAGFSEDDPDLERLQELGVVYHNAHVLKEPWWYEARLNGCEAVIRKVLSLP
jgi:hypothetical protein